MANTKFMTPVYGKSSNQSNIICTDFKSESSFDQEVPRIASFQVKMFFFLAMFGMYSRAGSLSALSSHNGPC